MESDADTNDRVAVRGGLARAATLRGWFPPAAILAFGAGLFLYRIGSASFWFDEAFSVQAAGQGLRHLLNVSQGAEANMILYNLLLRGWLELGSSEIWVRLLSAACMLGAVAVTWLLARRLFDTRVATVSAGLLAANAMVVRYAQEARSYALLLLLVVVATYLLVRALERGERRWWAAYLVVGGLIAYAQVIGALVLLAHAAAILLHPRRPPLRELVTGASLLAVAVAPIALVIGSSAAGGPTWIGPVALGSLGQTAVALAGGLAGPAGQPTWLLAPAYGLLIVLGATRVRTLRAWPERWAIWLMLGWLILPPAVLVIVSVVKPILVARYLIVIVPPVSMLAAAGLVRLRRPVLVGLGAAAVVMLALLGDSAYYADPGKPDWRGATEYIADHGSAHDRWLIYESWAWRPVVLYVAMLHDADHFPVRLWMDLDSSRSDYASMLGQTAETTADEARTIWVIATPTSRGVVDPVTAPAFAGLRAAYVLAERKTFDHVLLLRFEPRSGG